MINMVCKQCDSVFPEDLVLWVIRYEEAEDKKNSSEFDAVCPRCLSGEIEKVNDDANDSNLGI